MKKRVAVIWGGQSPEHDISVISGLQVFSAINTELFDTIPVYIDPRGRWFTGQDLLLRQNYMFNDTDLNKMKQVSIQNSGSAYELIQVNSKFFSSKIVFDIALPVLHGSFGENGCIQGMLETLGIPYAGMRAKPSSIFMDKEITKCVAEGLKLPTLPFVIFKKPAVGSLITTNKIQKCVTKFPCCVKPANLGSSIGVAKAENPDEVQSILSMIFKLDNKALVEPYIENLIEYNVAVAFDNNGKVITSAIERPRSKGELLTFKDKYLDGDGSKAVKQQESISKSLYLTRDINPDIDQDLKNQILEITKKLFTFTDPSGAPRLDFIFDPKTSKIWFNELNPIPGSYSYFLWEASEHNLLFSELLTNMLNEAESQKSSFTDVPEEARLLKRK